MNEFFVTEKCVIMYNISTHISNVHGNTVYRDSCGINHFIILMFIIK